MRNVRVAKTGCSGQTHQEAAEKRRSRFWFSAELNCGGFKAILRMGKSDKNCGHRMWGTELFGDHFGTTQEARNTFPRHFAPVLNTTIVLPTQARDKHRENFIQKLAFP
jgi:hypothetical protein